MKPNQYMVQVTASTEAGKITVSVDGESETIDGFEFVAPVGHGFGLKSTTIRRLELVSDEQEQAYVDYDGKRRFA